MKKIVTFCFILTLNLNSSMAQGGLFSKLLKDLPRFNKSLNNLEPQEICPDKEEKDPNLFHLTYRVGAKSTGKLMKHEGLDVSVLTMAEAQKLFKEFSEIPYMPYKYVDNGCFDRAQEFALIAERNGITMGKMFINEEDRLLYPKRYPDKNNRPFLKYFDGWKYHVAPFVMVDTGKGIEPFVFDVGTAASIQTVSNWKNSLSNNPENTKITVRDRRYMYLDSSYQSDQSSIASSINTIKLIEELGEAEYVYRWEQGWL
jgi:hypothetical protein